MKFFENSSIIDTNNRSMQKTKPTKNEWIDKFMKEP